MFISYYTKNTDYVNHVERLVNSLNALELPFYVRGIEDRGSWKKNVAYKPEFIKEMLDLHKKPLVFLDADAEVLKPPILFDELTNEYDLGVHYRDNPNVSKPELLSGTIWVNYTPEARILLEIWKDRTRAELEHYTQPQQILDASIREFPPVKVYELPKEYTRIFDAQEMGEAVIQHNQASRANRLN